MATLLIRVNDARRSAAPPPRRTRFSQILLNGCSVSLSIKQQGVKLISMLITLRKRYVVYIIIIFISFDCFLAFGEYECNYNLSETDLKTIIIFLCLF